MGTPSVRTMGQGTGQRGLLYLWILLTQICLAFCRESQELTAIIKGDDKDILDIVKFLSEWSKLYFPTSAGVEPQCREDSEMYQKGVASSPWALEVLDASGKFPDGIATGNKYMQGSYEECVRIGTEDDSFSAPFRGRKSWLPVVVGPDLSAACMEYDL